MKGDDTAKKITHKALETRRILRQLTNSQYIDKHYVSNGAAWWDCSTDA